MFHVNVPSYNISFSFVHHRDVNLTLPLKMNPKKFVHITDITLCDMLVNGQEFMGEACCVQGDAFKKESGRKVALTRALAEAKLPKDVRTIIWERYHGRSKS